MSRDKGEAVTTAELAARVVKIIATRIANDPVGCNSEAECGTVGDTSGDTRYLCPLYTFRPGRTKANYGVKVFHQCTDDNSC